MGRFIDLTGQRFGKLVVIRLYDRDKRNQIRWLCQCDCGNTKVISGGDLTRKNRKGTTSCGCSMGNRTHGKKNTRLYGVFRDMKTRCYNENANNYNIYGGRGIRICNEWLDDFMNFYNWAMSNGYDENALRGECTIDRIDVNGNYEPGNCRWVSMKEQTDNRRCSLQIEYDGKTLSVEDWEKETGIPKDSIYKRLSMGWSVEKTLNTPNRTQKHPKK